MAKKEVNPETNTDSNKSDAKPVMASNTVKKVEDEPFYTFAEFVSNPGVLGSTADIVSAALTEKGVTIETISKAKKIVTEFKERKVQ